MKKGGRGQTKSVQVRLLWVLILVPHLVSSLAADLLGSLLQDIQLPEPQTGNIMILKSLNVC